MSRDNQSKLVAKKIYKKKDELTKKRKQVQSSSSESEYSSSTEEDSEEEEEEEEGELDVHEYRKLLSKIFPSKYIDKKVKTGEKLKKRIKEVEVEEESDDESWETADEEDASDESDEEEEEEEKEKPKKNRRKNKSKKEEKVNIIFTIGEKEEDEWEDDEDSSYNDSEITEDEDEEVSTDEDNEDDEDEDEDKEVEVEEPIIVKKKIKEKDTKSNESLEQLKKILELNPTDKSIQKCIAVYELDLKNQKKNEEKKSKKQKDKNLRIFKKILKDKNTMNDFSFYEKMEMDKQHKLIKELREINKITRIEKPYRMTLLESSIPVEYKAAAMKKINSLRYMEPGSGEFYKSKNWVDTFMRIPFNKYEGLPITIDDGVDKCHEFMDNAKQTLDNAVYGLNDAKMQIMQMLGQLLTNPQSIGTAIAIHGPPGTGKTSLVKEGISKILNRPFTFIALGGATDSSFLEGHSYTYEGSTWGKIVQIIIESKCMNPVIYFDELDKISDTPRGEEIAGILTHLTDTSQNSQFHDKYFADINFDLSKCLFIFSYNDETKVNPILKDRMYRIKTKGYVSKEKTIIANNYLLPKIREQVRFVEGQIIIPNDVISHLIDTHCNKEDGVRNLKRCLEIIHTKLNLYRLMKPGSNLFEGEMSLNVEFPFTVTKAIVDKLIKRETDGLETWRSLYA
jgi:ATP-dependent Lon protease